MNPPELEIYVPDAAQTVSGTSAEQVLASITHLGIAAHPDDLEIMAIDGILKGFSGEGNVFAGVVLTDGRGAPRAGKFSSLSDAELADLRKTEQKEAARIGRYAALVFMNFASRDVRQGSSVVESLARVMRMCVPPLGIYPQPAGRTPHAQRGCLARHPGAAQPAADMLPEQVYGCEVGAAGMLPVRWRVAFDCSDQWNCKRTCSKSSRPN
jgi:hypothetical protein